MMQKSALEKANISRSRAAWDEWLAGNLMRGIDQKKITAVMVRNGFDEPFVLQKINEITASPVFKAGQKVYRSKRKILTLLETLSAQYRQSSYADNFQKLNRVSAREFYGRYYFVNRPVVIKGLMDNWEALRLWSPDFFAKEFGKYEVEITRDRHADQRYEDNFSQHRSRILMKDYVSMIQEAGETNDYYLVAKNNLMAREEFQPLYEHFRCPPGYLDPQFLRNHVHLWFGPKGTITPLHHDGCNILFGQIYGRKRIQLISPYDIDHVYNDQECFSAVDLEKIDYQKFPLMRKVSIIDVVVEPGEFILLPVGWWHWVKSLDISISLSFSNFCVDGNTVIWEYR